MNDVVMEKTAREKYGWSLPCTGCGKVIKSSDEFNAVKTTITFQAWKGKDAPRDMAILECVDCYKTSFKEYAASIGKPGAYLPPRRNFPSIRCIQCGNRISPLRKIAYRARYKDVKNLIGATCLPCATSIESSIMKKKFNISNGIMKRIRHENVSLVTIRNVLDKTGKKFPGVEIGVATRRESAAIARSRSITMIDGVKLRNSWFNRWWIAIFIARECNDIDDKIRTFVGDRIEDKITISGGIHDADDLPANMMQDEGNGNEKK
jgi:hypothetical protein